MHQADISINDSNKMSVPRCVIARNTSNGSAAGTMDVSSLDVSGFHNLKVDAFIPVEDFTPAMPIRRTSEHNSKEQDSTPTCPDRRISISEPSTTSRPSFGSSSVRSSTSGSSLSFARTGIPERVLTRVNSNGSDVSALDEIPEDFTPPMMPMRRSTVHIYAIPEEDCFIPEEDSIPSLMSMPTNAALDITGLDGREVDSLSEDSIPPLMPTRKLSLCPDNARAHQASLFCQEKPVSFPISEEETTQPIAHSNVVQASSFVKKMVPAKSACSNCSTEDSTPSIPTRRISDPSTTSRSSLSSSSGRASPTRQKKRVSFSISSEEESTQPIDHSIVVQAGSFAIAADPGGSNSTEDYTPSIPTRRISDPSTTSWSTPSISSTLSSTGSTSIPKCVLSKGASNGSAVSALDSSGNQVYSIPEDSIPSMMSVRRTTDGLDGTGHSTPEDSSIPSLMPMEQMSLCSDNARVHQAAPGVAHCMGHEEDTTQPIVHAKGRSVLKRTITVDTECSNWTEDSTPDIPIRRISDDSGEASPHQPLVLNHAA